MKTYQLESIVQENGSILFPEYLANLKTHRVKITLVDLEPTYDDPVKILDDITQQYAGINEPGLDIEEIYKNRK